MIRTIVCGVAGRMGGRLARLIAESDDLRLVGATELPSNPAVGLDVGTLIGSGEMGLTVTADLSEVVGGVDVVIDFTAPEATVENAKVCAETGKAMVVGTTGLSNTQLAEFKETVAQIPCVFSPNYSVGVNLLFRLVRESAEILGDDFDVEVIESHHRFKKDAPSGTAKGLAQAAAQGLSRNLAEVAVYGRMGVVGERKREEIGIHAVRAGDIVGEHTVLFGGAGERIELSHRASSRDAFARGALRAVRFVAKASPGLYDMLDVLGLK